MNDFKYYLSPVLEVVEMEGDRLAFSVYGKRYTLQDDAGLIRTLMAAAKTGVALSEFKEAHHETHSSLAVDAAVCALVDAKFLVDESAGRSNAGTDLFQRMPGILQIGTLNGQDAGPAIGRQIVVIGVGALARAVKRALGEVGFTRVAHADSLHEPATNVEAVVVCCADVELHAYFRSANAEALSRGLPVLYVSLDWHVARCGPLVVPGGSACYECYFHRIASTRRFADEFLARSTDERLLARPAPNPLAVLWGAASAATQVCAYVTNAAADLHLSPVREVNVLTGEVARGSVLKLPRCPACGTACDRPQVSAVPARAFAR